jgi:glycosyltransferase involved in cell wall biosynthesis
MIANIRPVKDLITLFRALAISKNKEKIGLIIAGSIAEETYFKICTEELARLSMQDQVIFQGYCDDIPALLACADFGVLSSERETGPIALLEYMAAGVPFVVTCAGQVANEVSKMGILDCVPIKDSMAFAQALDVLIEQSHEERNFRVEQAFKLVDEKFNIHHQIISLQSLYQKILND